MTVSFIAPQPSISEDTFLTLQDFSWNQGITWCPIDGDAALRAMTSNKAVLDAIGVDQETLTRRLSMPWTPEVALNDCKFVHLPDSPQIFNRQYS